MTVFIFIKSWINGSDLWQRNLQIDKCTNCLIICYKYSNGIVFVAKIDGIDTYLLIYLQKSYVKKRLLFQNRPKHLIVNLNISIVHQNLLCKIYISVAFISLNYFLNIDMNVNFAQKNPLSKICFNVAFNLYKITFEYKDL